MFECVSQNKSFAGWQKVYRHNASSTGTDMTFGIYLPPAAEHNPCPVVYWLSGLTCTEQNFITKAAAQQWAAELGLILVAPDTSPRGTDLPGEHEHWDFGSGAGFYVDAVNAPWDQHYRMHSYITEELRTLVDTHFPTTKTQSIAGHSMGGHGALTLGLKHRELYAAISAFAPISAPTLCPWGQKAFGHYFGKDKVLWEAHDAHLLIQQKGRHVPLLIDQGTEDDFLKQGQLLPEKLDAAARKAGYALTFNYREGYDHSFYFISSFIESHLRFHARHLT